MTFNKRILGVATISALSLAVTSCGGGGSGGNGGAGVTEVAPTVENGSVTLLATDAETDQFRAINLTITRAELVSAGGGGEVLFEGSKTINLLALADVTEVFSITEVPVGDYDKIRLTLTSIELVFHDERAPFYPDLPGNGKLDINPRGVFSVDSEEALTIELDFDAEKSLQIVSQGNGIDFSFRPVVFTKEVDDEFDTKLIRQLGIVRQLDDIAGTFQLCLPEDDSIESVEEDCVSVDASAGAASIFGPTGLPAGVKQLENGTIATVVGRFFDAGDVVLATASGVSLRTLEPVVSAFDEDDEDDEFDDEFDDESEDDESEDDESEDDESEDDESEDDESEDDESEDDESEDDESEDDQSEDDQSEDDESEDDQSEDDESEDGESEDDESEDDESEDDESEDDESEDDESEDDQSEDDNSEDDVNSGLPMTLVADVIWLGGDFTRTENVACNAVTGVSDSMAFDNAELPLADDALCAESSRVTVVTPGTRIYDEEGALRDSDDIGEGAINQVDGFVATDGDSQVVRAAMILLSEDDDSDDEREQLTGTIGVVESGSLTLLTDEGDRCVTFEDADTAVFESSDDGSGLAFNEQSIDSLASGQGVDAFGEMNDEGCLEADTIIYRADDS